MKLIDSEARHAALMFVATLAVVLSVGLLPRTLRPVRRRPAWQQRSRPCATPRDQVQRRQRAQYRHHFYGQW